MYYKYFLTVIEKYLFVKAHLGRVDINNRLIL